MHNSTICKTHHPVYVPRYSISRTTNQNYQLNNTRWKSFVKMANNDNNTENQNAIENLNSHLTAAGEKVANNKKIVYWTLGIVVIIAAICGAWFWFYKTPRVNNSVAAYDQVETKALGNDTVAAAEYAKVADKFSSTDAGNLAALQAAEAYYRIKKYNEAIKYLDKFSSKDELMEAQAKMLLGDCYVNLKKYDDALNAFNSALRIATGNEQIAPKLLWKEANIYDAQKKYQNALDCYQQIKDAYPEYMFGNGVSVDAYIAREKARLGK